MSRYVSSAFRLLKRKGVKFLIELDFHCREVSNIGERTY